MEANQNNDPQRPLVQPQPYQPPERGVPVAFAPERAVIDENEALPPVERPKAVMQGELQVERVKVLYDELRPFAQKHSFQLGDLYDFGLAFDVFDPQSGTVIRAARPHRRDVGDEPIMLTVKAIVHSIVTARQHQAALQ